MNSDRNPLVFVVEDITDDESEAKYTTADQPPQQHYPDSIALYHQNQQNIFQNAIRQQTKTSDDSQTAYGERYASSFGQQGIAPLPIEPSAPPFEPEDWKEYQSWMHAPTFADRSRFPNHERWSGIINQGQDSFRLTNLSVLEDNISKDFKAKLTTEHRVLLTGTGQPPSLIEMEDFQPATFKAQQALAGNYYDQVTAMMAFTEEQFKTSYFKSMFTGQVIPSNKFYVVSDHDGDNSGKNLQLWGPGVKKSLGWASNQTKQNLNRVRGSAASYDVNVDYAHVKDRFTIIRITNNERGFVLDRSTNTLKQMHEGRYVIPEKDYAYIGKTTLGISKNALLIRPHSNDPSITAIAAQIKIVFVTQGLVAFVKDNNNTYMLPHRDAPYILDCRRGENFICYEQLNKQVIRASDNSYTFINGLQPGQFITFFHQGRTIVLQYHAEIPTFNYIFLPANQYQQPNIHNINENYIQSGNEHVINLKPGQALVLKDQNQQYKFLEDSITQTLVIRTPWQFVQIISQNNPDYRTGTSNDGNQMVRLMLRSSEWAGVTDKFGHLAFYPPRLDNKPYYFLQPDHTVVQVINKNAVGETKLQAPGIGNVSVVNIPSGSIGACRLHNMHFFLNPSEMPYVFVPPDAFIEIIDSQQPHVPVGDLHRIVLKPEQRAIISKDGKLYPLPPQSQEDSIALSEENGVYIFRSFQFAVYGPMNKSEKRYALGPIEYFNVGVGEVGYGTCEKKLRIWEAGEHFVDNRKNEWFTDFFETNVDPVDIKDLSVTFKHGITGSVGVFVSFHIVDPKKAITHFKDHTKLHQFIYKTTQSEMIRLCASRPPLGYTELYFSGSENRVSDGTTDAGKAVDEIEQSFMDHAKSLLEEYGVQISKMYIDSWTLAEDFVNQVQANAKLLQDAHAKVEQTRMNLQQRKLENDQEIQRKTAEIQLKDLENKRLELELEAKRLMQLNTSKCEADAKILQAETMAKTQIEAAKAKAGADIEQAKASNEITKTQAATNTDVSEQNARAKMAAQRIEAETLAEIAQNKLNAKRMEVEAKQMEINTIQSQGLIEADIEAAKIQAAYRGLTSEERMQLQIAEIQSRNLTNFIHMMLQTGVSMPGVATIDPQLLQALQVPTIATVPQAAQGNFNSPLVMFTPPQFRGKANNPDKENVNEPERKKALTNMN